MLVELCNRALPYSGLYLTPLQTAIGVAERSLVPTLNQAHAYPETLVALIDACLQQAPHARPYFVQIIPRLKGAIAEVARLEGHAEAARRGSLLGRMSGMVQGAAAQAQAAAGLQRDAGAEDGDAFGEGDSAAGNGAEAAPADVAAPARGVNAPEPAQAPAQAQPPQQRVRAQSHPSPGMAQQHQQRDARHEQRQSHARHSTNAPPAQQPPAQQPLAQQQARGHGGLPQMRQSATSMFQGLVSKGASAMRNAGLGA